MTSVTTATIAPGNPTAMPMIASVVRPFLDSDAGVGADWDVFKIPDDPMPNQLSVSPNLLLVPTRL